MAATFKWCERNGASPGLVVENVNNVNWKSVDDSTTPIAGAPITAGTNSYTKWQFGTFSGTYNTIDNVTFSHQAGVLPANITLRCQKSMVVDSDRISPYVTPSPVASDVLTPVDFTAVGTSVNVFVGPKQVGDDGASSSGKTKVGQNPGAGYQNTLYTNYLVTQLRVGVAATPGNTAQITLRLTYDES